MWHCYIRRLESRKAAGLGSSSFLRRTSLISVFFLQTSDHDTKNFDPDFTMEVPQFTPTDKDLLQSMDQGQFKGFSFVNPYFGSQQWFYCFFFFNKYPVSSSSFPFVQRNRFFADVSIYICLKIFNLVSRVLSLGTRSKLWDYIQTSFQEFVSGHWEQGWRYPRKFWFLQNVKCLSYWI